jgi:antirestriction protein ArdC
MATTAQSVREETKQTAAPKRDFRQEVTDNLVQMLEKGVAPWQKPWDSSMASIDMPLNPTTGKTYRGGNTLHLIATALQKNYDDPRWMTYKQAAENGWQVRKGEKGTQIEFWDVKDGQSKDRPENGGAQSKPKLEQADERRLIHRVYTVFNASQVDGVPPHEPKQKSVFDAVHAGEQILHHSGAQIIHDQLDRAYYSRSQDSIHLPTKPAFKDAAGYYGTALHELAHWSGHPSRLNRKTLAESYRFGDVNYAKEELRAELASVFLAAERGIPHNPEQHAAYVEHWIKALKEDKNEIFRAAHDASKAADFLLGLERDRSIAEEALDNSDTSRLPAVAELQGDAARLERDRENLEDIPIVRDAEMSRESSQFTTRLETGSGTIIVHDKNDGSELRAVVDASGIGKGSQQPGRNLKAEQKLTAAALGNEAKAYQAQVESGTYRGQIVGETADHLLQRVSSRSAVAHPKELLDRRPSTGESVAITYSNGKASVREVHQRSREQEVSR